MLAAGPMPVEGQPAPGASAAALPPAARAAQMPVSSCSPSENACDALREAVYARLGALEESTPAGYFVKFVDGEEALVLLRFDSRFEQGSAIEGFTWRVRGGEARLVGYEIDSIQLAAAARR